MTYYHNIEDISNNIDSYLCACCENKLHIPFQQFNCSCGDTHLFNYSCICYKFNEIYNNKCLKINCDGYLNYNDIFQYIRNDQLIDMINQYYSEYVWLYESRRPGFYWIYNTYISNILYNKYNNIYNLNKTYNINCDIYKQYLIKSYNFSDYILDNILTYLNICNKCKKNNNFVRIKCMCNNKKKCTKKQCNGICDAMQIFDINFINTDDMTINFNNMTQKNKHNSNIRNIHLMHKNELIDNINIIQGVSSLIRDKNS